MHVYSASNSLANTNMTKCYPTIDGSPNFSDIEKQVLEYWSKEGIFEKSVDSRPKDKQFTFYDGPPFANGLPHYGHLLTGFIKDTVARFKTMRGFRVERRFGWDCHGLPVEMLAEKELGVSGKVNIENFGIDKFNDYCRGSVLKFTEQWHNYVRRQGRWVDFVNAYRTMDKSFMESVMWAFYELWKKGLIYESLRVVPYSWACQTPLSNFETKLDNSYREKVSKSVTVKFEVCGRPEFIPKEVESCKILAWTTTPWTLVANLALAVNSSMSYVGVVVGKELIIFSEGYLEHFQKYCTKSGLEYSSSFAIAAQELVSLEYKPLFPYFADCKNAFKVLDANFVTEGAGTGIVHMAPGFGEDDFIVCKAHGIPGIQDDVSKLLSVICPIDDSGRYTSAISDFTASHVLEVNDEIIKYLKERGSWFETNQYTHSYPYCWRTDTPLLYRAMPSWYVEVTKLQQRMISLNENINWIPEHIKDGQFGKWLGGIRDWSISRNRFWGAPVPVWKSDDPQYPRIDVYGSIEALEKDFGVVVQDLHRPYIDSLVRPNPDDPTGKSQMRRVPDVLDCWFESGSMPYAQSHYPFENKDKFESNFPADFITEYVAQTRGWFYTLLVLSAGIFDKHPFKNCICHGVVLDVKGQKLSKKLNNYPDPMEMFDKYGADSVRFTMLSNSVASGGDLLLDKDGEVVREMLKNVIKPMWNSYSFFTVYANADQVEAHLLHDINVVNNIMDQYILYETILMVNSVLEAMESSEGSDRYDIRLACSVITKFSDKLNNWYIRRCRERFWSEKKSADKLDAYNTLYTVLHYFVRVAAPFMPFMAESIWLGLNFKLEESVHLSDFPSRSAIGFTSEHEVNTQYMKLVMDICSSVLFLRNSHNLRVRQPLNKIVFYPYQCDSLRNLPDEYCKIILNETNIKEFTISDNLEEIASFDIKPHFPILGKRIPDKVKKIVPWAKSGKWNLLSNGDLLLGDEEKENCTIYKGEFDLNLEVTDTHSCKVVSEGVTVGVVSIDPNLTEDLILEGAARDVIRLIQQSRKECKLEMLDRIKVIILTKNPQEIEAIAVWRDFIKHQTLCESLVVNSENGEPQLSDGEYLRMVQKDVAIYLRKVT